MLLVKRKYTIKYFATNCNLLDLLGFTKFIQYSGKSYLLKKSLNFSTIHIDLSENMDVLYSSIKKNVRYEIKRAGERDNLNFEIENNLDLFIDFYNSFSETKPINSISKENLLEVGKNNIKCFKVKQDKDLLAMHLYICDSNRARLFLSATTTKNIDKNLIARANKFLHWEELKYFKEKSYKIYDMGGCRVDENEKAITGIGKFKQSFGGIVVYEHQYLSWPLFIVNKIIKKI